MNNIIQARAHNFWIELLANYGILIFIPFIIILILFFVNFIILQPLNIKKITWPVTLAVLIFIPGSFISSSVFQMPLIWFVLGLMVCTFSLSKSKKRFHISE